jgi:hypothetical protein
LSLLLVGVKPEKNYLVLFIVIELFCDEYFLCMPETYLYLVAWGQSCPSQRHLVGVLF